MDLADRYWVQVVVLLAADLAPCHEVRGFEHGQVLHHAEARQLRDHGAQLTQREAVLFHETIKESAARRLGQRTEHVVHASSKGDSRVTCQAVNAEHAWANRPRAAECLDT